jgi:hypothetical protein
MTNYPQETMDLIEVNKFGQGINPEEIKKDKMRNLKQSIKVKRIY